MKEQEIVRIGRQKRLNEVYDYLRLHYGVHTKKGFAEVINMGRTSLSSAMNGDPKYLTKSLFKSICKAYPDIFDLEYLLTGEGQLLAVNKPASNVERENENENESNVLPSAIPLWAESLIDLLTKQVKENEALMCELKQAIADLKNISNKE